MTSVTDYQHLANLCSREIERLQKLRASYRRAAREQERQAQLGMQQLHLPDPEPLTVRLPRGLPQ